MPSPRTSACTQTSAKRRDDYRWEQRLDELTEYRNMWKTFVISKKDTSHKQLREWMVKQRRLEKIGKLAPCRRSKLLEIGFTFGEAKTPQKKKRFSVEQHIKWHDNFLQLLRFKKEHGHCDVGYANKNDLALAKWVSHQRATKGIGQMDEVREKLLQSIDFRWKVYGVSTEEITQTSKSS